MVSNPITADTVLLETLWQTTAWLAAGSPSASFWNDAPLAPTARCCCA